ncbi:MAG TPA: cysteine hydrolase family protein [Armatimonadota bacterium]|jgi:nicotinamidase-related amidase
MSAKSLRQLAGLKRPTSLDPGKTALILIDIQMDYFTPDKLYIPDGDRVAANASRLREWAGSRGIAVVHIQQVSSPASPIFASGTPGIDLHPSLTPRDGEAVFSKTLPSSFDRTGLHEFLQSRGITTLVLAGLMTHMCVETTARGALPLGYAVIVASDACASRDLPAYDAQGVISHQEVHRNALTAMADRFADILTTDSITRLE